MPSTNLRLQQLLEQQQRDLGEIFSVNETTLNQSEESGSPWSETLARANAASASPREGLLVEGASPVDQTLTSPHGRRRSLSDEEEGGSLEPTPNSPPPQSAGRREGRSPQFGRRRISGVLPVCIVCYEQIPKPDPGGPAEPDKEEVELPCCGKSLHSGCMQQLYTYRYRNCPACRCKLNTPAGPADFEGLTPSSISSVGTSISRRGRLDDMSLSPPSTTGVSSEARSILSSVPSAFTEASDPPGPEHAARDFQSLTEEFLSAVEAPKDVEIERPREWTSIEVPKLIFRIRSCTNPKSIVVDKIGQVYVLCELLDDPTPVVQVFDCRGELVETKRLSLFRDVQAIAVSPVGVLGAIGHLSSGEPGIAARFTYRGNAFGGFPIPAIEEVSTMAVSPTSTLYVGDTHSSMVLVCERGVSGYSFTRTVTLPDQPACLGARKDGCLIACTHPGVGERIFIYDPKTESEVVSASFGRAGLENPTSVGLASERDLTIVVDGGSIRILDEALHPLHAFPASASTLLNWLVAPISLCVSNDDRILVLDRSNSAVCVC